MGLSLAAPSGSGLGLHALRWLACVDQVTDASAFPYCLSFDEGLGRCTGAVSCGRRHLLLRVRGRHTRIPCLCACACSSWPGRAGRPPWRVLVRLTCSFGCFIFLLCLAPSGLGLPLSWSFVCPPVPIFLFSFFVSPLLSSLRPLCLLLSLVSSPGCPGTWRCVLFVLLASRFLALPVLSLLWCCLAVGCSLAVAPPPPLLCLAVIASAQSLAFFLFSLPLGAPLVSGFLWFPALGALGLGAVFCLFWGPPAARLSVRTRLVCVSRLAVGSSLVVAAPPPFVSRGFTRCRSVLCAVCCAVLCVPGCGAAPRCCALCRPVLCCCVLCCFVAFVWCRCLLCCALWRCPAPWGRVLCGAVFWGVPPRCVLCAVCVLSRCGGARCCSPLCSVLCVSWGAVLYVPCPLRSVRCCAPLCWCACVVLFVLHVLLLAPGVVVCCCVLCCFFWCAVVRCWVWWPVVVCWWRVSVSMSPSGRVVCFPVVGVACCGALLPCVVFCGALLSRGAVLLCAAVVLWCCWCLLCPSVACRAVLCCAVRWPCCFVPCGGVCVLWCSFPRAVRSMSSPLRCCALLCWLWCPASLCRVLWHCAVAWCCAVVLCCRFAVLFVLALPSCGLLCGAVLCCVVLLIVCAFFALVVALVCCGALSLPAGRHETIPHTEKKPACFIYLVLRLAAPVFDTPVDTS